MLHSRSHFDFALINISFKHLSIPLQNSELKEIANTLFMLKINNFLGLEGPRHTCECKYIHSFTWFQCKQILNYSSLYIVTT